ncbi:MAG: hypothetical protein GY820_06765 [Gammaproteobacteria bacterium]|nr:hypothetical protein [Gammaproteobacteria bacterium]
MKLCTVLNKHHSNHCAKFRSDWKIPARMGVAYPQPKKLRIVVYEYGPGAKAQLLNET